MADFAPSESVILNPQLGYEPVGFDGPKPIFASVRAAVLSAGAGVHTFGSCRFLNANSSVIFTASEPYPWPRAAGSIHARSSG